jgi:group I intron endonuclease
VYGEMVGEFLGRYIIMVLSNFNNSEEATCEIIKFMQDVMGDDNLDNEFEKHKIIGEKLIKIGEENINSGCLSSKGIYNIINLIDHKKYLGSTIIFNKRFNEHKRALNKGVHHNAHLQSAYNKYGKENFVFLPIVLNDSGASKSDVFSTEQRFLDLGKRYFEYNINFNASGGGGPCGENSPNSKLTNEQAEEIRDKWWNNGKGIEDLVDEYGVIIYRILRNETYENPEWGKKFPEIKDKLKKDASRKMSEKRSGENNTHSKLTNEQAEEIRYKWWKDGREIEDLVDEYGVRGAIVRNILNNGTYEDPEWGKKLPEIEVKIEKDRRKKISEKISGENCPHNKLTSERAEEIRDKWWNNGKGIEDLADEYGVTYWLIYRILRNETYKNPEWGKKFPEIKDKLKKDASRKMSEKRSGENNTHSELTNEQAEEIRDKWKENITIKDLAKEYGVNRGVIERVINNITYISLKWGKELPEILKLKKQEKINRNENIVKDRQSGMKCKTLVEKYKLSESTIKRIIKKIQ